MIGRDRAAGGARRKRNLNRGHRLWAQGIGGTIRICSRGKLTDANAPDGKLAGEKMTYARLAGRMGMD